MSIIIMFIALNALSVYCLDVYHESSKITYYPDDSSEYFGYTVILNSNGLIIGAPKAKSRIKRTISPGQVFICGLGGMKARRVPCTPLGSNPNDPRDLPLRRTAFVISDFLKNDMWFGATIAIIPEDRLMICSPRWAIPYRDTHLLANGECFMQTLTRQFTSQAYLPLHDKFLQAFVSDGTRKQYGEVETHLNYYAYGQAGFSIKAIDDSRFIIGAPGLLQWAGTVIEYTYHSGRTDYLRQNVPNPYYVTDLGPDDYFGYSVESGVFEKDGAPLYVAAAPRSRSGYGLVLIFKPSNTQSDPLDIKAKIRGTQLGAYFGASLLCADLNGDGVDDLLVGAPNFVTRNGGLPYDQGAVFIYLTNTKESNLTLDFAGYVFGSGESGARFGSAIANLGDIDDDGYNDIAVGSPWESSGSGAVYIYKGNKNGLKAQFVQKITVEDAKSFGISISKGLDIDSNNCSDLAVGAHISKTAYLFRCIPTIHVEISIKVPDAMNLEENTSNFTALFCVKAALSKTFSNIKTAHISKTAYVFRCIPTIHVGISIKVPDAMNLEEDTPNFTALFCVKAALSKTFSNIKTDLRATIIIDPKRNRARISNDPEYNVTIQPGNENCEEQVVEVMPNADASTPISMKFKVEPIEIQHVNSTSFPHQTARLSGDSIVSTSFDIQLMSECGDDLICRPLLQMNLEPLDSPYVPGSNHKLGVKITVINTEEPAFGAKVYMKLPASLKRQPTGCSLESKGAERNLTCTLPAPLYKKQPVEWEIELEYTHENETVHIEAVLDEPFFDGDDKLKREISIPITPKATFLISGKVLPNATVIVTSDKIKEAANLTFAHYFEVTNLGPSDWLHLRGQIFISEKVKLSSSVKGCSENNEMDCIWELPAKTSLSLVLPLRISLEAFEDIFGEKSELNITTRLIIYNEDQTISGNITTAFIVEPPAPIWPIIIGCIFGFILLSIIIFLLHKCGFFFRNRYKELNDSNKERLNSEGSSSNAEEADSLSVIMRKSTEDLLDDSD